MYTKIYNRICRLCRPCEFIAEFVYKVGVGVGGT